MSDRALKLFSRIILLALVVAIASPLAACGRKGSPEYPEGTEYPRSYPKR